MANPSKLKFHVLVCAHKHCLKRGGRETAKALKRALKDQDLTGRALLTEADCLDQCDDGPCVVVYPDGVWYGNVDESAARLIVERHLTGGPVVAENLLGVLDAGRGEGGAE
jgi:(2Fe-2S) ferredoxin